MQCQGPFFVWRHAKIKSHVALKLRMHQGNWTNKNTAHQITGTKDGVWGTEGGLQGMEKRLAESLCLPSLCGKCIFHPWSISIKAHVYRPPPWSPKMHDRNRPIKRRVSLSVPKSSLLLLHVCMYCMKISLYACVKMGHVHTYTVQWS